MENESLPVTETQVTPTPVIETSTKNPVIYPWIIVGQPSQFLGSREGGLWVFYNPSTKSWSANGKSFGIDNTIDLVCEGTTKLVNESNFTFFKVTPNDPSQPVFLSPTTIANSFIGYNCKVDTYRRETFDFSAPSSGLMETSNLENTD